MNWLDVNKKYHAKWETTGKKISQGGIRRAMQSDEDYQLELTCPRGSIYRYSDDGEEWGVYIKPVKSGGKRKSLFAKMRELGLEPVQTAHYEGAWKFPAEKLDLVADAIQVRKRYKLKKK